MGLQPEKNWVNWYPTGDDDTGDDDITLLALSPGAVAFTWRISNYAK